MSRLTKSATYVFCLVQAERPPSVRGVPAVMPGAGAPRALAVDRGLWAIVADAPLDRFSSEHLQQELQDIEAVSRHALAHASIVEFFFRRSPVVPLKLFTLFSDDARARQHLAGRSKKVRKLFADLRGLEEWGVRIFGGADPKPVARKRVASGRDYLEVKKQLRDEAAAPSRATAREVGAALKVLGRSASKARKEAIPPLGRGQPSVAGSAFLVEARRRQQWKKLVKSLSASLDKQGHRLELSGPWPPYHFVS